MSQEQRNNGPRERQLSVSIPAGVEKMIYLAATDQAFRGELLQHRDQAAEQRGFTLSSSEAAMLRLAPEQQLSSMINALDVSPANLQRRGFLQTVAASAAVLTAGGALAGCPDDDQDKDSGLKVDTRVNPGLDAGGIQPDISYLDKGAPKQEAAVKVDAVKVDVGGPKPAGIRPDDGGMME